MKKMMLQGFEWYIRPEDNHWQKLSLEVNRFKMLGFSDIWLPPASKGHRGLYDSGYGVYDLYDLGEFDQKGSVRTKYGTYDEYLHLIKVLKDAKIKTYVDIVLNHKIGSDALETIEVKQMNPNNRLEFLSDKTIDAWTKFNFDARHNKYSNFKWNNNHFTGIDYDARTHQHGIYLFKNEWDSNVSHEMGNYDYLMGADVDFRNPEVLEEMKHYLDWYRNLVGFEGVRLDAVKHINAYAMKELLTHMTLQNPVESVGEYWSANTQELEDYLRKLDFKTRLFDVNLHHKFYDISKGYRHSIKNIFEGTLHERFPEHTIVFVDNHDTQIGQSLESWIEPWFRHHAYAFILLNAKTYPCVFYTDLNDTSICDMMILRKNHQTGNALHQDISDSQSVLGYDGDNGYIASINIGETNTFTLNLGSELVGRCYIDKNNPGQFAEVAPDGTLTLVSQGHSVTIYIVAGGNYEGIL